MITDCVTPLLSGPQMATQGHALRPELPIALVSAHATDADAEAIERARFAVRIVKPPSAGELARALRTMLDRSRGDHATAHEHDHAPIRSAE